MRHDAVAHPVGFSLHVAGKIELGLCGHSLPAHHQSAGGIGAFARGQDAQKHGPNEQGCLLRLFGKQPRQMALGNVAELMREHRGQLVLVGDHADETEVNAHVAAGQGKGIDAGVFDEEDLPGKALQHVA